MPAPYLTGAAPDEFDRTLETARTLDRHLQDAIGGLAQQKGPTMPTTAPGGFAAGLRAILDEAKAGLEQAQKDGRAKVGEAVAKLKDATTATLQVSGTIAQAITEQADEVMSDLGQISNLPPE